jgi:molybdopterin converting factor small subunit
VTGSVRVLFFASAREAVGRASVTRPLSADSMAVDAFLEELAGHYPGLRPVLRISRVVQNGTFLSGRSGRVRAGDEIAIYPPYSGG